MNVWQSFTRHGVPRRFLWMACALILAVAPLTLVGQAPQAKPAQPPAAQAPAAKPASQVPAAKPEVPLTWADKIIQQETYATPPPELAEAVTAPRYQNISLSNLSPDKKWFLNTIGDGPVVMATFSKPFHELGGVFIDFKANRVPLADDQQQRRHPGRVGRGRDEEAGRDSAERPRVERRLVARRQRRRVPRPHRRRDAHLDDRPGDEQAAPGVAAAAAGHHGVDVRVHEGRQADRRRADPGRPRRRCRSNPAAPVGPAGEGAATRRTGTGCGRSRA